ncbi:hypothetical protein AAG906_009138 [Vitis piasezkii]
MSCYAPPTHWCRCCNSALYQAILVATSSHGIAPWPNHHRAFDLRCMLGAKNAQVCGVCARSRASAHAGVRASARKHVCNRTCKHASNRARGYASNRAYGCSPCFLPMAPWVQGQPKRPFVPSSQRRDGRLISLSPDALNLPAPTDSIHVLRHKFVVKGLNNHDLVTLVGAHTIGQTDCSFFQYRLYNFMAKGNADPTINQAFLAQLHALFLECGNVSTRVPLDKDSQIKFNVSFFKNVRAGNGILELDQRIFGDI